MTEPLSRARLREVGRLLGESMHLATRASARFTSTLSLDEVALVRGSHVFPRRVVCGAGSYSLYFRVKSSTDEHAEELQRSWRLAFDAARRALVAQATDAEAVGVIGVDVDIRIDPTYCSIVLSGTALEPGTRDGKSLFPVQYDQPFITDLSASDFVTLTQAGWYPRTLVGGAGFVNAARRDLANAIAHARDNVELTNPTEALSRARQMAMQQFEDELGRSGATGVVDAKVIDSRHDHDVLVNGRIMPFIVWGTAVWQPGEEHLPNVSPVLPVDH